VEGEAAMTKGRCFVCLGEGNHVSEMTDGLTNHLVCDGCRELVTPFFYIYGSLSKAVSEAAQAKRGPDAVIKGELV